MPSRTGPVPPRGPRGALPTPPRPAPGSDPAARTTWTRTATASRSEASGSAGELPAARACPVQRRGRTGAGEGAGQPRPGRPDASRAAKVVAQVGSEQGLLELPRRGGQVRERLGGGPAGVGVLLTKRRSDDLIEERGLPIGE